MKNKISNLILVIGLLVIAYPFAIKAINHFNQTTAISNYKKEKVVQDEVEKQNEIDASNNYNNRLASSEQIIDITDNIDSNNSSSPSKINFMNTSEVIGNLVIPKINVNLPIYDGATEANLKSGVVHLDSTSYPTGDASTHCVIAGHSGLTGVKLLDDLDKLEVGDNFEIDYLSNTTNYEVIDKKIVLPDDTSSLKIQEGETLVTLVTCTPKYINTHRLLVTAKKVDIQEDVEQISSKQKILTFLSNYGILILLILVIIIFIVVTIIKSIKNKKENKK